MTIVLASQNAHKKAEIAKILDGHDIHLPIDIGVEFDVEETGSTFLENALIKARHLYSITGEPSIADDSGLCVPALNGAPGIYSARYGALDDGTTLSDGDRNEFLLANLESVSQRSAYFVCSMVLMLGEERFYVAQETVHGEITLSPQGTNGFGYDPLFYLEEYGKTIAQLPAEVKNAISHRGKATSAIANLIAVD